MPRHTKEKLLEDVHKISVKAAGDGYGIGARDYFALGYMCGKYGVERLYDNQEEVIKGCQEYDKTDELALLDTIGETLIDMEVIKNDGRL